METIRLILLISGCVCILFGYFRLLSDNNGNVDLNNYRLTGGLGKVLCGIVAGTRDLLARKSSPKSTSAIAIYCGVILFIIGMKI